jgi:deoxyribodipyrimidine photo-lyase
MTILCWLRRDLRLHDNVALMQAAQDSGGAVVPCYVLDETLLRSGRTGAARLHFLLESLRELGEAIRERGGQLIVRRGEPLPELLAVARAVGAQAVYFNRDYSPFARARANGE